MLPFHPAYPSYPRPAVRTLGAASFGAPAPMLRAAPVQAVHCQAGVQRPYLPQPYGVYGRPAVYAQPRVVQYSAGAALRPVLRAAPPAPAACERAVADLQDGIVTLGPDGEPLSQEGVIDGHGYKYSLVQGIVYPPFMKEAVVRDLMGQMQLRDSDMVIATFPKCGTTWMQQILLSLLHQDTETCKAPMEQSKWIEMAASQKDASIQDVMDWDGSNEYNGPTSRRVWKTHCCAHLAPWVGGPASLGRGKAKAVVVGRNPFDACVSLFHHSHDVPVFEYTGDLAHFTEQLFAGGYVESGCFWEWYAGWEREAQSNPDGVLWVTFEEMKADPLRMIRKVADFFALPADDDLIARVAGGSSFEAMKKKAAEVDAVRNAEGKKVKKNHIRRGAVGAWRNDFKGALRQTIEQVHAERTQASGLQYAWDFGEE